MRSSLTAPLLLLAALGALWAGIAQAQAPDVLAYTGYLRDGNGPVNDTMAVRLSFYESRVPLEGEVPLWSEGFERVVIVDGRFVVHLGAAEGGVPAGLVTDDCYLEVTVDGETLEPRVAMTPVPSALYASEAGVAEALAGFDPASVPPVVEADCGRGSLLQGIRADGSPICASVAELLAEAGVLTAEAGVRWDQLTEVPSGFADGEDDDSVLSEAQVDAYVANNGYLDAGSPLGWNRLVGVPAGFADGVDNDRVLTPQEVLAVGTTVGFLSKFSDIDWAQISGLPAGFADGVDDDSAWPEGPFCIMRAGGVCPSGFEEGHRFWDDADDGNRNRSEGALPDGVFDDNTLVYFCCQPGAI